MRHRFLIAAVSSIIAVVLHSCTMRDITEVPVVTVEVQPSSVTVLEGGAHRLTARARDGVGKELPIGAVTWASDASDVFSIDATGWGEALSVGTATVWATLDGIRGSATVSVEPGPRLVVQAPQLQFFLDLARVAPETLTLQITNGGGGGIGGISATAYYPEGGASGWLSLSLSTTSAPSTLTVSVPSGLLEEGVHEATIVLASDDALNSPISVPVQAVVTQNQPIIHLSPRVIEFQAEAPGGPPPPLTVQVTNAGGGVLSDLEAMPLYLDVGNWLWTSLTGTTAPAELLIQPDPDGLTPGTYFAEVRVIGPDALNTPQSLTVTFTVTPGPASPAHSTATVPDGSAGLATSILLRTRDELGNPLTSGGDTVVVRVSGANDIGALDVTDQADGTYTASYTPTTAGTDLVAITIKDTPVNDSPFTSSVAAGPVTPGQSTATVPDGALGLPTKILVQARDAFGNRVQSGGETVAVTVSGANNAGALTVTDQADGTYTASYTPATLGTDTLAITMNGTRINGSPFTSEVGSGVVSPEQSTATVPNGTAGLPTDIVVQARDAYGNPLGSGGETVVVTVSGANDAGALTVSDQADGTYTASYTPARTGTDVVEITLNGAPISGSPFASEVGAGVVNPGQSTATVPDGRASLPTEIVVQARDVYGNPLSSGGETVVVTVSGANDAGALTVTDQADGTYTAGYTPTRTGTDVVEITLNGAPISGSPFASEVGSGPVSPDLSTATVPDGTAGFATEIVIQTRDGAGNPMSSGGEPVVVTVSGANDVGALTVTDNADGTYSAGYTPTRAGTDAVVIAINGAPISGSPFASDVSVGPVSPAHSTAIVPDGTVGVPVNIVVQARDAYGNPLSVGGEVVTVTVTGKNPTWPMRATDMGDGTYTASYTPERKGNDKVYITMNRVPISGSPFICKVSDR